MASKCVNCGCSELIDDVSVIDNYYKSPVALQTLGNPRAMIFKDAKRTNATGKVCTACGFVMLFVTPGGIAILRENPVQQRELWTD
jgi:hypothetical protein